MALNSSILWFLILVLMGFWCSSEADHTFNVGWSLHPREKYNHWAERNRFQINDRLVFKFNQGHDSVLVVNKKDYTKCNKENPIKTFLGHDSVFKIEKSGPLFFISGHNQNCEKGQKLNIIVLSQHHHNTHKNYNNTPSASSPSPSHVPPPPPFHSPSPSPPTAKTPSIHTQTPASLAPSHSPTQAAKPPTHHAIPSPSPTTAKPPTNPAKAPTPSPSSPTHAPPVQTPSPVPHHSQSIKTESPKQNYHNAPAPQASNHAPAPAPSAASDRLGVSSSFLVGFGLAAIIMISVV